jgi:hypothetical protein
MCVMPHRPKRNKGIPSQGKKASPDVVATQSLGGNIHVKAARACGQLHAAAGRLAHSRRWHARQAADKRQRTSQQQQQQQQVSREVKFCFHGWFGLGDSVKE